MMISCANNPALIELCVHYILLLQGHNVQRVIAWQWHAFNLISVHNHIIRE